MIANDLMPLASPIDALSLLPGNPRQGDVPAVAKSLEAFGQRKPIVARRDGTVIAGNHTLQAARSLGWPEIAVVWVDDDDATASAFALADNRTAELGGYDDQALADLIASVQDADAELLAATGWSDADLAELLEEIAATEPLPTIDDPVAVPDSAPSKTVPGDVWLLGEHRLMCGDSTIPTDVDKLMAGDMADMVWTDPPYGVAYVGGTADSMVIENDDVSPAELEQLLRDSLGNALSASTPGAPWFVAGPDKHGVYRAFVDVLHDLGVYRQSVLWVKDSFAMGRMDYHCRHEMLFYGWAPGAAHTPPPDRKQDTVWEFPKPRENKVHPTMKPVALVERSISNHTSHGAIVLDVFGGSGTTMIAAHLLGRRARLMELDPKYCDVICKRFQQATGIAPIAESTGNEHDFREEADDGGTKPAKAARRSRKAAVGSPVGADS